MESKVPFSISISPEVKRFLLEQAEREDRTTSNLAERLLVWSIKQMELAGNSEILKDLSFGPTPGGKLRPKRVPDEQQELHSALDLIFERAQIEVAERVAKYLSERAGKHGDKK